jgi:osmoprotectant transport system ATP-binding protein
MFELDQVGVRYPGNESWSLAPTDFTIQTGETIMLLGPSGSGKSTLLRTLAGLTPYQGTLLFEGAPVMDWRALRHRLGYVIQDGGLFPHLTARGNVALMARELGWKRDRIAARIEELAVLAGLDAAQLDRFPGGLSGGQRQRVAMMRALMLEPDVLLFDEPLSALDPITRLRLATELKELIGRLGKTVVFVTHNMREAHFFRGRAVLMNQGRIVQQGSIEVMKEEPAEPFVTEFLAAEEAM